MGEFNKEIVHSQELTCTKGKYTPSQLEDKRIIPIKETEILNHSQWIEILILQWHLLKSSSTFRQISNKNKIWNHFTPSTAGNLCRIQQLKKE
jgi:hypothetical protein